MTTPNKLHELLTWKKDIENRIRAVNKNYKPGEDNPLKLTNKLTILGDELKVVEGRIKKLGTRYNVVRVHGVAKVPLKGDNTQIMVQSKYEFYFSDISLADAREKVHMHFGTMNIVTSKPEIIRTGEAHIIGR